MTTNERQCFFLHCGRRKSTASVGSQPETDIKFTIGSVQSPLSAQSGDATPVGTPPQSLLPLFQYKLTCDDAGNDFVRANFYYDEVCFCLLVFQ